MNIFLLKLPFPLSTIQETLLASRCPLIRIEMANAYVHSEDRQRSLAAGWLLQYVAATFLKNTQLEQIPIIEEAKTEYGRSFLPSLRSLNVSITHSGPYVACAASPHDVGIDIEKIQNCDLSQENFGFMSVTEEKTFHSLSQIKKKDFFFDTWTKKEALLKALGMGFQISPNTIDIEESESKWNYYSRNLPSNYRLAICMSKIKGTGALYEF